MLYEINHTNFEKDDKRKELVVKNNLDVKEPVLCQSSIKDINEPTNIDCQNRDVKMLKNDNFNKFNCEKKAEIEEEEFLGKHYIEPKVKNSYF